MFRTLVINLLQRVARPVALRLARDIELMQVVRAGTSSADFAIDNLAKATIVRGRDSLLLEALKHAKGDGLVCEFGVYKGHTLNIIAKAMTADVVYGFDSFEGLPEAWRNGFDKGKFKVEAVGLPTFPENVKLYSGWFDATLPRLLSDDDRQAMFLHIDCDLYSSTKCIFELLAKRLRPGTVIVFDEYFNFPGWKNYEHRALIEAAHSFGFTYDYILYNPLGQQVAIVVTRINGS